MTTVNTQKTLKCVKDARKWLGRNRGNERVLGNLLNTGVVGVKLV